MKRKINRWTEEEIELLKELYSNNQKDIATYFPDRTPMSVYKRIQILNLEKPELWSEEELQILRDNYPELGPTELAKSGLLPEKDKGQIVRQAFKEGLKTENHYFTEEQDNILVEKYPTHTQEELAEILGIPKHSVDYRIRVLGLQKRDFEFWTPEEEQILYDYYPTAHEDRLQEMLPNRTKRAIVDRAHQLGLLKTQRYFSEIRRTHDLNVDFYKDGIVSDDHACLLGYIFADGTLRKYDLRFRCEINDWQYLEKIKNLLEYGGEITESECEFDGINHDKPVKTLRQANMGVSSVVLYNDLQKLGVEENKTLILKPPKDLNGFEQGFIRGFFEGDGSIYGLEKGKPSIGFASASRPFIKWLKGVIMNLADGGNVNIQKMNTTHNPAYRVVWSGRLQIARIGWWIYEPIINGESTLFMQRKFDRFVPLWRELGYL